MLDYSKIMPTFALFNLLLDKSYGRLLKDYPRLEMSSEWTTLQVGSGLCVIQRIRKLRIVIRRLGEARLYRQLQRKTTTNKLCRRRFLTSPPSSRVVLVMQPSSSPLSASQLPHKPTLQDALSNSVSRSVRTQE